MDGMTGGLPITGRTPITHPGDIVMRPAITDGVIATGKAIVTGTSIVTGRGIAMAIVTGHHTGQGIGGLIAAGTVAARPMTVGAGTGCIERPGGALTVPGRAWGAVKSHGPCRPVAGISARDDTADGMSRRFRSGFVLPPGAMETHLLDSPGTECRLQAGHRCGDLFSGT